MLPKETVKAFQVNNLFKYLWCVLNQFRSTRMCVALSICLDYVPMSESVTYPCALPFHAFPVMRFFFVTHFVLYFCVSAQRVKKYKGLETIK